MTAPRLNVPLDLEAPEHMPDGMGGYSVGWRKLGRVWAEMRSGAGGERATGLGQQSVVTWRITLRAAPMGDPRRPRAEQCLTLGTGPSRRRFRIDAVAERDGQQRYLVCFATEEISA